MTGISLHEAMASDFSVERQFSQIEHFFSLRIKTRRRFKKFFKKREERRALQQQQQEQQRQQEQQLPQLPAVKFIIRSEPRKILPK
jgi:hypothetical protein